MRHRCGEQRTRWLERGGGVIAAIALVVGLVMTPLTVAAQEATVAAGDWTGFHVGVNVGYGFGEDIGTGNNLGTVESEIDGIDGGLQIGYDHQFGRYVLGGEADFQVADESGRAELDEVGFPGSTIEGSYDSFGTVRLRAGVVVDPVLLYATGGYAYRDQEIRFKGPISARTSDSSLSLEGWTVGVGIEPRLSRNLSLKGELLFLSFSDEGGTVDNEFYSARVGLNWRF